MNLAPSFGILAVLYIAVMAVLIGLAIYVLILVITFLRLRIAELRRTARPNEKWILREARRPYFNGLDSLATGLRRNFNWCEGTSRRQERAAGCLPADRPELSAGL